MTSTQVEVLNIANTNARGEIVLNDEKLLELIQLYPFLYNPRIRPFDDADYNEWAWERIASTFNHFYDNTIPRAFFSSAELEKRWRILKPIIVNLSKVTAMTSIPEPLRQIVIKISVQLEDQKTDARKLPILTPSQQLIYDNIAMVEQLPLAERKRLEAEMMELILNTELNLKGCVRQNAIDTVRIEQEYEEFLKSMKLKELFVLSNNQEIDNDDVLEAAAATPAAFSLYLEGDSTNSSTVETDAMILPDIHYDASGATQAITNVKIKTESISEIPERETLLERTVPRRWIPLSEVHLYIRKCVVRLKRLKVEDDDVPLAFIKRERKWQ